LPETTNKRETLVAQILLATLGPQIALLVLAALAIWFGVASGMKSLDDITRRLTGYRPDRPATLPAPRAAPIEVRPLLVALHQVVNTLGEAQAGQQRFIANASHQLRTPLAALQVQAERACAKRIRSSIPKRWKAS
jgi:signal transduction histidine kinase